MRDECVNLDGSCEDVECMANEVIQYVVVHVLLVL